MAYATAKKCSVSFQNHCTVFCDKIKNKNFVPMYISRCRFVFGHPFLCVLFDLELRTENDFQEEGYTENAGL
jgi:hypothetical protein